MSIFFIASKILNIFLDPVWQLALLIAACLLAKFFTYRRVSNFLWMGVLLLFCLYSFIPFSQTLLRPLENYAQAPSQIELEKADGIIVLGGFTADAMVSASRNAPQLGSAAERVITAISLHQDFPEKPIWFSGFSSHLTKKGRLIQNGWSEDVITARLLADLNLSSSVFNFEKESRNTAQNAQFTYQRIQPKNTENWILITSASHMRRADLSFKKAGWKNLNLMPVDYLTPRSENNFSFSPLRGFQIMRTVFHEYFGLLFYKITGRI